MESKCDFRLQQQKHCRNIWKIIALHYLDLDEPQLKFCIQFLAPYYKWDRETGGNPELIKKDDKGVGKQAKQGQAETTRYFSLEKKGD